MTSSNHPRRHAIRFLTGLALAFAVLLLAIAPPAMAAPPSRITVTKTGTGTGSVTSSPAGISCGGTCSSKFTTGTVVTLTATASAGSTFAAWSGSGCSGTGTCVITASANKSVTATFTTITYSLSVSKTGTGAGTVTSSPAGINCGATCGASFSSGTVVTLTAAASAGSTFTGWSGSGCSGTGTCVVTMNSAKSVTATFTVITYTLTVSKTGTGTGTVTSSPAGISCGATCGASFNSGAVVSLAATAAAGSAFTGWSGACSGTGACSVTMSSAKVVTANFDISVSTFLLSVSLAGAGSGTVVSTPSGIFCGVSCSASYASGTPVTMVASSDPGYTFAGWSGDCSGTGSCDLTMGAAHNVTATFSVPSYQLSVTKSGTGNGKVTSSPAGIDCGATCDANFNGATIVTLTANPNGTSTFTAWTGACSGTGTCDVTMDSAKNVTATFTKIQYLLTVTPTGTGGGTVTSSPAGIDCPSGCSASFDSETSATLTATPDADTNFDGWSGAGCSGTGTCSISINADKTVTAIFTLKTKKLTVTLSGSGSGSVSSSPAGIDCGTTCSFKFDIGTHVTLTAAAAAGSSFVGWSGDCTGLGPCHVTMDSAMSVDAQFTLNQYQLSVVRSGAGSGTVTSSPGVIDCGATCSDTYNFGRSVTLTASAAADSDFTGWSGGGCSGTSTCIVTISADTTVTAAFALKSYDLTVTKTGAGTGTVTSFPAGINCGVSCSTSLDVGTLVTLTAVADPGSTFLGWSGAGCSGTAPCLITMDSSKDVVASFAGQRQPDGAIKLSSKPTYLGVDVLNTDGAGQTATSKVPKGKKKIFLFQVTNKGAQADTFTLVASKANQKPFTTRYYEGATDITGAVVAGTYTSANLVPDATASYKVVVKASKKAKTGTTKKWLLTAASSADPAEEDVFGFQVKAK